MDLALRPTVLPGREVGFGEIAIDLLQARFWIVSVRPTTRPESAKRVLTTSPKNSESTQDPKVNLRAPGPGSCHRATIDKSRF
jgi:hypothetical protein